MFKIIEKTKIWFSISLTIIIAGFIAFAVRGLNFGIDFKGGSVVVVNMEKTNFDKKEIDNIVLKYDKDGVSKKTGDTEVEISVKELNNEEISKMYGDIKSKFNLKSNAPEKVDTIGASVGKELKVKAIIALIVANVLIMIYVSFRFEYKFGIASIISLAHDILITMTIYAIFQIPINLSFIAAILTILGYSMNDTIVVFDRIRENSKKIKNISPKDMANMSITQTLTRSINTGLTTLITIAAVHVFVPSVREFTFPIILGIVAGCYSSIFIASPIWVMLKNKGNKKLKTQKAVK